MNSWPVLTLSRKLSSSGFGALHGAISSLAAKVLSDRHWTEAVKPQTDAELADASTQSLGALLFSYGLR